MKLKHKSVNAIQHILRCNAVGAVFPLSSIFFILYLYFQLSTQKQRMNELKKRKAMFKVSVDFKQLDKSEVETQFASDSEA